MIKHPHLVVLRFSALGDVAMVIPVLRCLFIKYPELQITFVTKKPFEALFHEFPNLKVFPIEPKKKHQGILGLRQLYREIEATDPTGIVDLHGVLRTHILRLFFFLRGIPFIQIDKGRADKKALTRPKKKFFKPLTPSIHRYAEVFQKMGYPIDLLKHEFPPQPILHTQFSEKFPNPSIKWVGIAPFASFKGKQYPLDLMQQVVAYLQQEYQVFLFGAGKKEEMQLNIWEKAYKRVHNTVGKYSFSQELYLIAHLDLMISMDSANAHMAANYGIKVLTLWGITHPYAGFGAFAQPEENHLLADREQFPLIPTSIYGNYYPPGYEIAFRSLHPKIVIEKAQDLLA